MKEKIYDEQISPLMRQIIDICKKNEIAFFAAYDLEGEEFCFCNTLLLGDNHHPVFDHFNVLHQSICGKGVNVDKYFTWIKRHAYKHGHSSINLKLLGINESGGMDER